MGIGYWLRTGILLCALVLVVLAMYSINHRGLNPRVAEVLTGERVAKVLPQRVDLCATRVKSLKTSHGVEIFESGMSWFRKSPSEETKLDPVEVEKWFGHNCSVTVENLRPVASNEIQAASPILIVDFIQGTSETIKQSPSGEYIWKQISFRSKQLESALEALSGLRAAGPDGRALPSDD